MKKNTDLHAVKPTARNKAHLPKKSDDGFASDVPAHIRAQVTAILDKTFFRDENGGYGKPKPEYSSLTPEFVRTVYTKYFSTVGTDFAQNYYTGETGPSIWTDYDPIGSGVQKTHTGEIVNYSSENHLQKLVDFTGKIHPDLELINAETTTVNNTFLKRYKLNVGDVVKQTHGNVLVMPDFTQRGTVLLGRLTVRIKNSAIILLHVVENMNTALLARTDGPEIFASRLANDIELQEKFKELIHPIARLIKPQKIL